MTDFALKISKTGINVGTVTDNNDLVFSSELNTLKIKTTDTHGTAAGTVAHGLSYTPIFLCNKQVGTVSSVIGDVGLGVFIDSSKLDFGTGTYRYYIIYQEGI